MYEKTIEDESGTLEYVPNYFKTQRMCKRAVENEPYTLKFVPDWFITKEQIGLWHDEDEYCNDDEIIEWYNDYKKRKAQKAKIKEELLPIAWHPLRWWDWCMSEDERRDTEALWA